MFKKEIILAHLYRPEFAFREKNLTLIPLMGGYLHFLFCGRSPRDSMAVQPFILSGCSLKMRCSAGLAFHLVRSPIKGLLEAFIKCLNWPKVKFCQQFMIQ